MKLQWLVVAFLLFISSLCIINVLASQSQKSSEYPDDMSFILKQVERTLHDHVIPRIEQLEALARDETKVTYLGGALAITHLDLLHLEDKLQFSGLSDPQLTEDLKAARLRYERLCQLEWVINDNQ